MKSGGFSALGRSRAGWRAARAKVVLKDGIADARGCLGAGRLARPGPDSAPQFDLTQVLLSIFRYSKKYER